VSRYPLCQIGINGNQFNAEADAYHKTKKDHPFRLMLKRHDEGEQPVPEQGIHKGRASANAISIGAEQAGTDKKPQKSCGRKRGLVGHTEHALLAGVEDAISNETGADVACLKQIVKLKKTAKGQQGDESPKSGGSR